jgi:hypothetical protein
LGLANIESLWLDKAVSTYGFVRAAADLLPRIKPKEFFRPGQVDQNGNFNNLAIGKDFRRPRLRLPGSGGIPDVTTYLDGVYLYVPRHTRVTFVQKLDFCSGLGHHKDRRRGSGAKYLVSDLGEFDFPDGKMRLKRIFPGVSVERIKAKTGFDIEIAPDISETEPPTEEEKRLLNEEIDPLGVRHLEALSGAARRKTLRMMLEMEHNR